MPLINQISIPRFDSLLSKLLGIKERQVAPSVGTELVPVVSVQDPSASELSFIKGEQLLWLNDVPLTWGAFDDINPILCFGNPLGSGKLITIERIQYYPAPEGAAGDFTGIFKADWVIRGPHAAGFGGVGQGFPAYLNPADWDEDFSGVWRDTRWWSPANAGGNLGHALKYFVANKLAAGSVGGGSNCWSGVSAVAWSATFAQSPVAAPALWEGETVLSPGSMILMYQTYSDLATAIKFDLMWRERPLEDSEVRPGSS